MRAIIEHVHGAPEVLHISERPVPEPKPGQVLIRVRAAGVNRADSLQRRGYYPPPPGASSIYGLEVAGTVAAVGAGVPQRMVGARVAALLAGGGYAEYVVADARHTFDIPKDMGFVEAACLPEVAATVYSNLVLTCGMSLDAAANRASGTSVLIHGGTGGIGLHAIQLARAAGTRVFATVGTRAKADAARAAGAEPIIYSEQSFREAIADKTGGAGVNYILDVVGGLYLDDNLRSLADGGHLAIIGLQGGAKAQINLGLMLTRRLSVHATSLRSRSADEKAGIIAGVRQSVLPLVESGAISANLDRTFELEQAALAHTYFDSGEHRGKIVLTVGER
ncbi:MAG: NAD(P)H-quinone oxidoreductase [Rothia sp. (in: high G+C Gram-positive bacteria)]|uniref:NAD(P)H-quinone oxidoreductase n=1 Tax=Rothia sp. (in: high G+C Gram-positive bacteria) TaxID=1885016 RepID=UPI0026DBCBA3|nr:NAD(P)H-quinone oxidoreductase [Rothia sp. (in: high G+C Gram-positive bacteria)]MDO4884556.1 NAD(P)H-quinone oxidoreductase [Rothia sp. (in: high G+C Gram-positive bacteria)]